MKHMLRLFMLKHLTASQPANTVSSSTDVTMDPSADYRPLVSAYINPSDVTSWDL